ncbi:BrnT family toxin [Tardiphaga alba]|uniref:BrnT family toxin n=1 Tax=Tardiphaga alba TaxID=340268 RepID=A0ABX8AB26_9BRAD|nr:BrnT family toxin [Tardiphaga alba]QUS40166.1 BrnT family toxin [Tardiphaga alba]
MADFDPTKEAKNLEKHHISLERWGELSVLAIMRDDRFDYGEPRYRAYGLIDGQSYCLVFTMRDGAKRPISLRRAHAKEMKRYVT